MKNEYTENSPPREIPNEYIMNASGLTTNLVCVVV